MGASEFLSEHLWLVVWLLITLFSFFRKKRTAQPTDVPAGSFEELRRRLLEAAGGVASPRTPSVGERLLALERRLADLSALAEADPRLEALGAAVADLPERVRSLRERLDSGEPVASAEYTVAKLERAASWLEVAARQRGGDPGADLVAAERVAELARAPFAEFCRAQGIAYRPRPILAVRHGGRMERALRADSLPFTLVAVGSEARRDPRALPLVAREIGESIFFDVPELASHMSRGLSLPEAVRLPASAAEARPGHVRAAFGPYLADLFADLYATSLFGPGYVESLLHLANHPRAKNVFRMQPNGPWVSARPPIGLRIAFALEVLERLGRVSDAKRLRHRFDRLADEEPGYSFPAADGSRALVPRKLVGELVHEIAPEIIGFHHPTLEGFRIAAVPGLGYLHAEHAATMRARAELEEGRVPTGNPLFVLAAAASLAAERPELAGEINDLTHAALRGEREDARPRRAARPSGAGRTLAEMSRDRRALAQAVALGAALGRRPGARAPSPPPHTME